MKKVLVLLMIALCTPLFASLEPFYDPYYDSNDPFMSPALLGDREGVTHFAFEVEAFSATDYLCYLASPASGLSRQSDYLYDRLMAGDEAFWAEYGSALSSIFSFDDPANLPQSGDIGAIRAYLEDSYAKRFSSAHKAQAVLNAAKSTDLLLDSPALNSDAALALKLYGGVVYGNGFGWRLSSNIGFVESGNMLSGTSMLAVDVRGNVGYAIPLLNDRLSLGLSIEALALMQSRLDNVTLLQARFDNNPLLAFDNDFKCGLGFALNFGTAYRHSESLAFTLDLTNVASFRKFYDLSPTDFVDFDGFEEDGNVYYQPMDLVLRALWNEGPYHLSVEFSDVIDQMIWMNEVDGYSFDFFAIPKVEFTYDLSDDLSLGGRLGHSRLAFLLSWQNLDLELSTSLDKLAFGMKFGMGF